MDFAQNLPMSYINYVDNHILEKIEDFIHEYMDEYLNDEEKEDFNYDLAVAYVKYRLNNI